MGIYVGLQDEEATAGNGKSALSVVSYYIRTQIKFSSYTVNSTYFVLCR